MFSLLHVFGCWNILFIKCKHLLIFAKKLQIIVLHETVMQLTTNVKYLGLIQDKGLTRKAQQQSVMNKA